MIGLELLHIVEKCIKLSNYTNNSVDNLKYHSYKK